MQTDTIMAFQIEDQDLIAYNETNYRILGDAEDDGDGLRFKVYDIDEDNDSEIWFGPFDVVTLVVSLDDDEDIDVEDVDIDV